MVKRVVAVGVGMAVARVMALGVELMGVVDVGVMVVEIMKGKGMPW